MAKETIQEAVGKFIYNERKKQKLSLVQLSIRAFGDPHSNTRIMNIEKGKKPLVALETISKILKGLGYDMADLFKH